MKNFNQYINYLTENKTKKVFLNQQFIKDFEGSKVVDTLGNPILMHHGGSYSNGDFKGTGWFTRSKNDAKYYAKQNFGNITSAYIVIKNPLFSGNIAHLGFKMTKEIKDSCEKRNLNNAIKVENSIIQFIETNGAVLIAKDILCDGVIDLHDEQIIDVVIFESSQILQPVKYL
jgi:hypothetical protein